MGAPRYMRFYPDSYRKHTIRLTMEEQGVYMRLLCTMWHYGGKIPGDDKFITNALPINHNKWLKVKPQIMPYLIEHSPGFLTQKRLSREYTSVSKKKNAKSGDQGSASQSDPDAAPQSASSAAREITPYADNSTDENGDAENHEGFPDFSDVPEGGVAHALARTLDQSKSRSDKNNNFRLLEDCGGDFCGNPEFMERSVRFVNEVITLFEKQKLNPPGDYGIVLGWIKNGCDLFLHILPAVEAALKSRVNSTTQPPQSWKYFVHEVYALKKSKKEK